MTLSLTHTRNEKTAPLSHRTPGFASLELKWEAVTLFRYIYDPDMPQSESPKPFFHPVNTLAGDLITNYRPHDHVWHKGIQMTIAHLDGQNFWGGGSYRHGEGYVDLPNNGSQRHDGWDSIEVADNRFAATEKLSWITQAGERWIDETRGIAVETVDPAAGYWALDFTTSLRNVRGATLHIGSPTTAGRPLAGYGGLFWRGPRSFDNGAVITAAGHERRGGDGRGRALAGLHGPPRRQRPCVNAGFPGPSRQFALSQQMVRAPDALRLRQLRLHVRRGVRVRGGGDDYAAVPAGDRQRRLGRRAG